MDPEGEVPTVEVQIDGSGWHTCSGNLTWHYDWSVGGLKEGSHTIQARAYDGVHYSELQEIVVNVVHPTEPDGKPTPDDGSWGPVLWLVVILVAVGIVIGYLRIREDETNGPEE